MKKRPRKICFLTGKRGGFGALIPTFELVDRDPAMELVVIATDMHLSEKFGRTIREVDRWISGVIRVPMHQADDRPASRSSALGKAMSGITAALARVKPDVFVVLGDRGEVYVAVCAALHLGIPVAHIQGGDVSGNVDDMMRHAITKMAQIHFPATRSSARRIIRMGEELWRVRVVGDPHVDMLARKRYTPALEVRRKYGLEPEEAFGLILLHPETYRPEKSYAFMKAVLEGIRRRGMRWVLVYPCSDHGYQGTLDAIDEFSGDAEFLIHKNIPAPDFWGLEAEAAVFIGNSSAGLIEAPYFNLPFINIGLRQNGRERGKNVVDVPSPTSGAVKKAVGRALSLEFNRRIERNRALPFGDGRAGERMVSFLKEVPLGAELFEKRIAY